MFVSALLVSSFLTLVVPGTATCPSPFFAIGEGCYFYTDAGMIWEDARAFCRSLKPEENSDLAVMDYYCDDFMHIASYAISNDLEIFWVGVTDKDDRNYWTWVDGRPADKAAHYWYQESPATSDEGNYAVAVVFEEVTKRMRLLNIGNAFLWPPLCQLGVQALK